VISDDRPALDAADRVPASEPLTELRQRLIRFVDSTGIPVSFEALSDTLLPGLDVRRGALCVDLDRWLYPGDILHEAGHFAVAAPDERKAARLNANPGDELAAIAWSYAASAHLGIASEIVFHAGGYRGGGLALVENFAAGRYIGVPLLAWYGMTIDPRRVPSDGSPIYPHMLRWLR
jgi:hypothetical protein